MIHKHIVIEDNGWDNLGGYTSKDDLSPLFRNSDCVLKYICLVPLSAVLSDRSFWYQKHMEGNGSVIEILPQDRGIMDLSLTGGTALCY